LAPLAIVAVAATGYGIARSTGRSSGDGDEPTRTADKPAAKKTATTPTAHKTGRRTYVVRSGDTLSAISLDTGVTVEQLQALNPNVDVQALRVGQRLRLRR
jgi:teichoic acid transport system ATP-binding protein